MRIYSSPPWLKYLSINISKLVIGTSLKKIITDMNNSKTNMKLYVKKNSFIESCGYCLSSIILLPFTLKKYESRHNKSKCLLSIVTF